MTAKSATRKPNAIGMSASSLKIAVVVIMEKQDLLMGKLMGVEAMLKRITHAVEGLKVRRRSFRED